VAGQVLKIQRVMRERVWEAAHVQLKMVTSRQVDQFDTADDWRKTPLRTYAKEPARGVG
jgi:hypothetical protein